uniref:Rab_C52 protein n=1 Tax=Paramecium tetraurelia TaxID=5888 RepID=Q3SDQ6_PARTE|nr:rab_C52 [Paramecium tetraurelia]
MKFILINIQMQKVDYIFKIVLIGSQNVGKSSLMARFIDQVFNDSYLSTVGVDFRIKTLSIHDKTIKMQIWDTAGQERFQALTQSHYKGAHGCIAVFDVTNERSFEDAKKFLKLVIEEHGLIPEACYLIANKWYMNQPFSQILGKNGNDFAHEIGVNYLETSAKTGDNVNQLFLDLGKIILNLVDQKRTIAQPPENDTRLRTLDTQKIEQEQGCKC